MEVKYCDFGIEDDIVIHAIPGKDSDIKIQMIHEYDRLEISLSVENARALQTKISQALQDMGE